MSRMSKNSPIAWAWRVFCRRLVEWVKRLAARLRDRLANRAKPTRPAARRRPRPPRCDACELFVAGLCRRGCGVCLACCPGHKRETDQSPDNTSAETS